MYMTMAMACTAPPPSQPNDGLLYAAARSPCTGHLVTHTYPHGEWQIDRLGLNIKGQTKQHNFGGFNPGVAIF